MRIVMKIGGSLDGRGIAELVGALETMLARGWQVILVHGGGPAISRKLTEVGMTQPFVNGLRETPLEAIEMVVEALQACNRELTDQITKAGLPVQPLLDGTCFIAEDIGRARTGDVVAVAETELLRICSVGRIPLLPPYGRDEAGEFYNLNADVAAAHVASACQADKLVFCTDVSGVYSNYDASVQLFDTTVDELNSLLAGGSFSAGMVPKVLAMLHAHANAVPDIWVVDGRDGESLQQAVAAPEEQIAHQWTHRGTRLLANLVNTEVEI